VKSKGGGVCFCSPNRTGDFNRVNLKKVMTYFRQHITCATRGERTLDHCYMPFKRGYKAASLPPFGKSDHAAIFLLLEYKQRIVREVVATREVDDIRDAMSNANCDIIEFTDMVMSLIAMLEDKSKTMGRWIHLCRPACQYCCLQLQPRIRQHGQILSSVLRTTASSEGCKEELQRQSGGADGAARH